MRDQSLIMKVLEDRPRGSNTNVKNTSNTFKINALFTREHKRISIQTKKVKECLWMFIEILWKDKKIQV